MPQAIELPPSEPAQGLIGFEFTIVMGADIEHRLLLPQRFRDGFEISMVRQMLLRKASAGQLYWWEVKVEVDPAMRVCWEKGWPDFVHAHDLEEGDIVKFRYRGQGHLYVMVFDSSHCRCFYRPLLVSKDDGSSSD